MSRIIKSPNRKTVTKHDIIREIGIINSKKTRN